MGANKNILLISYHFPPLGMSGVGRPYALHKYLGDFGYKVYVLTVKNVLYPQYDYSLLDDDDESRIHRTGSFDPLRLLYLLGFRHAKHNPRISSAVNPIYFPDLRRGWNYFALRKAKKLIVENNIRLVLTTSPPPSSHMIGLKLKQMFDIKWIADFRDFWFSLPIEMVYKTNVQKKYAQRLKNDIVKNADAVVTVNNSIKNYLGEGKNSVVIFNGADLDTSKMWHCATADSDNKFRIGILGTINHLSPIEPLLKTLHLIFQRDLSFRDKLFVVHVGRCDTRALNSMIEKYSLEDNVRLVGYLRKNSAIKALAESDMLYFSVNSFGDYHILPSRTFDYLCSGRPVLANAAPASDAARLFAEYGDASVIAHDQVERMADYILEIYNRADEQRKRNYSTTDNSEKYSTRSMVEKYSRLLDKVLA
jgi:glycosyltransferase involved in cell wall biosynthesis